MYFLNKKLKRCKIIIGVANVGELLKDTVQKRVTFPLLWYNINNKICMWLRVALRNNFVIGC